MRKLAALIAVTASLALAGCKCGAFSGGGDQLYQRGTDVLILCENGAFVEKISGTEVDGLQHYDANDSDIVHGTIDNTSQVAFTLTRDYTTSTATAPELPGTWTMVQGLNEVEIDNANMQCTRLEQASWWGK
jgi:hypothetical protein